MFDSNLVLNVKFFRTEGVEDVVAAATPQITILFLDPGLPNKLI
jgi:hypothetical protein